MFSRGLRSEDQAEHIQIEMLVEVLLRHVFQRGEFVDARFVHQDVEPAKRFLRPSKQPFDVGLPGNISLHRDSLTSGAGDFRNDLVRAGFAGGVISDHRRAFDSECFRDGRADALGGAGNHSDFAGKFSALHFAPPLANAPANCPTRPANGISSAAYRSPAFGLALSLSISTATVA